MFLCICCKNERFAKLPLSGLRDREDKSTAKAYLKPSSYIDIRSESEGLDVRGKRKLEKKGEI